MTNANAIGGMCDTSYIVTYSIGLNFASLRNSWRGFCVFATGSSHIDPMGFEFLTLALPMGQHKDNMRDYYIEIWMLSNAEI